MAEVNLDLWHLIENLKAQHYIFEPHGNNRFTITSPDGQIKTDFNGNGKPDTAVHRLAETMHEAFGWTDITVRDGDDTATKFKKYSAARKLERMADPDWDEGAIERAEAQARSQLANNKMIIKPEYIGPWEAFQILEAHEKARIARGLSEDAELDIRAILEGLPFLKQRNVSEVHKGNLGKVIALGRFLLTHQGVAIAEDGYLLDGQHRILAVLEEGLPIAILTARNVPNEVFPVIDTGRRRTVGQIFGMRGVKDPTNISSAVRILYWYDNEPAKEKWFSRTLSEPELLDMHLDKYVTLEDSMALCKRAIKKGELDINIAVMAAVTHIILRADPRAPIEQFWATAAGSGPTDPYWYDIYGATYIDQCPAFALKNWAKGWSKRPGNTNNRGQRHTQHLICSIRSYNEAIQGNRHKVVVYKDSYAVPRPIIAGRGIA